MTNHLEIAKASLLEPADLSERTLEQILAGMLGNQVDAADLYFQSSHNESWVLEDGIVKEGAHNIERGVGVRALSGEKTGFAYSDDILLPTLESAASAAKSIAKRGQEGQVKAWAPTAPRILYPSMDPLSSLTDDEKVNLLREVDEKARSLDKRITQVIVSLAGSYEVVLIAATDGTFAADVRPLVRMNVSVIAEEDGRREQAHSGGGGRGDYRQFLENNLAFDYAEEAVRQALLNLKAVPTPAGPMPVVLGPGWPGVLLHEAVGHGLEGDFNRKGSSAFSGRVGQRVATPLCTVVDDGTIEGRRGSLNIDDEGTSSQYNVLIEEGILKGYMQDKLNAKLMGQSSTGNARRESYAHVPMPRMTNTYMLAGPHDPQEIIESVDQGLYAVNFGGGQVDITSGQFVFSASEAYLIEGGKVTTPVKGATLIGHGPEVLTKVSMVGHDLELDTGVGVCGKEGQSVPVGVGQPTLKVDSMVVGGTETA